MIFYYDYYYCSSIIYFDKKVRLFINKLQKEKNK